MRVSYSSCGVFLLVATFCAGVAFGMQSDGRVLDIVGKGAEGRQPYRGGGKVKFLSVSMPASLVHIGDGERIPAGLAIDYQVLQTAPVILDSRLGSEYWSLYNYTTGDLSCLHSRERIGLGKVGGAVARADILAVDLARGSALRKGLCGIRSRSYFLIVDAASDEWLDVVEPNPFWHSMEVKRELTFSLANLDRFSLKLDDFQSTWKPGGKFRVRLSVMDADSETFPVPRAEVKAQPEVRFKKVGPVNLQAMDDSLSVPLGHFEGALPSGTVDAIVVTAKVTAQTRDGTVVREITARFSGGEGRVPGFPAIGTPRQRQLPRTPGGKIIETRAIWCHSRDFATPDATDAMIARIKQANLNVVIPIVYCRGYVMFRSEKLPMEKGVPGGFGPLAFLVEKCHGAGLEVHPWFCVAYFGAKSGGGYGPGFPRYPDFSVVDKDGKPLAVSGSAVPADMHNPDYQKFVVDVMAGVAGNYPVDGIHLDYIRTMTDCYCQRCRRDFEKKFGHPLGKATDEEWVKWNKEAVGKVVRETSELARKIHKGIIVSAAVFANLDSGARQGQDAPYWADSGFLDVVLPMDYTMDTFELRRNEQKFLDGINDDSKLATGISLYVRSGKRVSSRDPSLVLEQIAMVRSMGIRGFSLFCYDYLSEAVLEALRKGPCTEPAVPAFRQR